LTTVSAAPTRERLLALDVFRGMTVAGMLLVNNPGSWGAIYPPLRHAPWHGWTPTDLIFPFFLFIVGITTHLSITVRRERGDEESALLRHVLRRGAIIVVLGLLVSAFPYYPLERITEMRIPGVLQRIGIAYAIAAVIFLRTSIRQQLYVAVGILVGYWLLMTVVPVPGRGMGALLLDRPDANLAAWFDRLVLDGHLWRQSRTWDPEGILSTIPAVGTVLLGIFAGRWIGSPRPLVERVAGLASVGAIAMVVGLMWNWSFPINKNLWTSSYVVFTAGMACVAIATCLWVIDEQRIRWWTRPFEVYGLNPLIAFVGSGIMARLIYSLITVEYQGAQVPLQAAIYRSAFASWLPPRDASLLFAVSFVLLWFGILWLLARYRIVLRV
jgi:predicted acyltransferase